MNNGSNMKRLTVEQIFQLRKLPPSTAATARLVSRLEQTKYRRRRDLSAPIHIPRSVARLMKFRKVRDA